MGDTTMLQKVTDWLLTEQGYPLEMRVARAFQAAKWEVGQSMYYTNDQSVSRELDVIARRNNWFKNVSVSVEVVVECKHTSKHPWVAFTAERAESSTHDGVRDRIASEDGVRLLEALSHDRKAQAFPFFRLPDRVSYGVTEAFHKQGHDVPYGACLSVASAAATFAGRSGGRIALYFPVVVIDGHLVEAYLDKEGKLQTSTVGSVPLFLDHPDAGYRHLPTVLSVVTESTLAVFVAEVSEAADYILSAESAVSASADRNY